MLFMVKIKVKEEMPLLDLLSYIDYNGIVNRNYRSNKDNVVTVDANGYIYFKNALEQSETFSVT